MLAGLGFGGRRGWTSVEGAPGAGVVATYPAYFKLSTCTLKDLPTLHGWLNDPRVDQFWQEKITNLDPVDLGIDGLFLRRLSLVAQIDVGPNDGQNGACSTAASFRT
jgi:hypothetical protein